MKHRLCLSCREQAATRRLECYSCSYKRRKGTAPVKSITSIFTVANTDTVKELDGSVTVYKTIHKGLMDDPSVVPAAPVVSHVTVIHPKPSVKRKSVLAVVLPDVHIGFRQTTDGLEPLHDIAAVDSALSLVAALRPEKVIWLGDFLDLPTFSKYPQESGLMNMTQLAIDEGHSILSSFVKAAPKAQHYLFEGNHDARLLRSLTAKLQEASLLTQESQRWPALSVPSLLRVDDLGVEYLDGYPARRLIINGVQFMHGHRVVSAGSTAARVARDVTMPTVFGHIHRRELHTVTGDDGSQVWAACPGTLSRTDGAVPSISSAVSSITGGFVGHQENWQQGVGVVEWVARPRYALSRVPQLELAPITASGVCYRGRFYVGKKVR